MKNKHIGLLQDPLVPPLKDGTFYVNIYKKNTNKYKN